MRSRRRYERLYRPLQWRRNAIVAAFAILAFAGCRHEPGPEALYQQIEKQFIAGELSAANSQSRQAYLRFQTSDPEWAAKFRLELAKVLIYQGKSAEALELLKQPLSDGQQIESEVRRKNLLAIAQTRLGHMDQAERILQEAEKQCPDGPLRGEVASARGSVDMEKDDLVDAARQFQLSLTAARANKDQFLQSQALLNLGHVALGAEHYEDALAQFHDASMLARSIGAKLALEKIVGNIGWVHYKTGDFERSLADYKEAEATAGELGSSSDQVAWLNNAGLSEYRLGDFAAARKFYEQSLILAKSIQNQQLILDTHVNLGFLLLRQGDPDAAEIHVREANRIAGLTKQNSIELEPNLLNALLLDARGDKPAAIKGLLTVVEQAGEFPSLKWEAESDLARIYSSDNQPAEAGKWFQASIATFQRQRSSLTSLDSTLPFLANGNDLYVGYTDHLIQERKTEDALKVIDESRAESLADGLHLAGLEQRKKALPDLNPMAIASRLKSTILVYSLRPKSSYLWVITPQQQRFYRIAGSETILPLIQLQNKMILASKDLLGQTSAPGKALYAALIQPAQDLIGKDSKIFIIGDDALSRLNFETLQTSGDSSHYWIEDVTITNAKSLRLLSASQIGQTRYADKRILLIGDPVYRKDEYTELPNASAEVSKIANHFSSDRRTVLTGAQASPEAYQKTQAAQFSYIHFVAHATANMMNPLDSAVVLSRNQNDSNAYKLYAGDILKQNLHADLVTLSSCYGSGMRDYSGEGLVGLAWAFLRAGSHQVIGAMWEVSDVSTPLMMDRLYEDLSKGKPPAEALRAAKLAMIHSDGVFRKPLYWAPFQLYSGA
jgi:CHAT domain-containing protein/Tfp pilus assembly protein PilF